MLIYIVLSTFRRRGSHMVRLAGVLPGVGFRCGHRRVEHRFRVEHALGMRCFCQRTRSVGLQCAAAFVRGGTDDMRMRKGAHVTTLACAWSTCVYS